MSQVRWVVVTTYPVGADAESAIERLKSAGISAVRQDGSILAPWNAAGEACEVLGVEPRSDADHVLRAHWENPHNWNRDGSYRCAEDPRVLVRKSNGVGWTMNMAHKRAPILMWSIAVAAAAGVIVAGYFAAR